MENVLDINNWIIVGKAMFKMLQWGWPIVVAAVVMLWWENPKDTYLNVQK